MTDPTPTVAPQLPDEAIEAAYAVAFDAMRYNPHVWFDALKEALPDALAAALPHIVSAVRDQIAGEIEALSDVPPMWDVDASWTFERKAMLTAAARIARGGA